MSKFVGPAHRTSPHQRFLCCGELEGCLLLIPSFVAANNGFTVANLFIAVKDSFAVANPRLVFLDLSFTVAKHSFVEVKLCFAATSKLLQINKFLLT